MRIQHNKSWLFVIFAITILSCSQPTKQPVDYVDPFICTQGDHGHWLPAALVPFGMVELGPDTYPGSLTANGDFAHGGYDYSDKKVRGFSHIHRGSSGGGRIRDRAGLLSIVPFSHNPSDTFFVNPVLDIEKTTEYARAGYYKTLLTQDDILVELTASEHGGIHRYTFGGTGVPQFFINSGNRGKAISCRQISPNKLEGSIGNKYFVVEFNHPVTAAKSWDGVSLVEKSEILNQPYGGLVCSFQKTKSRTLQVKVGLSLTSINAARMNMEAECPGWDFEGIKTKATKLWNDKLSAIKVEGENEEDKTIFYTALFHTCFLPHLTNDVDGTYPGLDKQNHVAEDYKHYNNYAFWDSFRTKYPLYSIWIPDVYRDIVKSLRDIYEQAGNWDPFPDNNHPPHGFCYTVRGKDGYNPCSTCRHEHMLMVMTDAYFKGLFDFPMETVYPYMKHEAMIQMPERYDSIGYIPARPDQTGEYSWDNWCMAQLAIELGKEDEYNYFIQRAGYWENTWDPSINYFRARSADGSWLDFPDDPTENREKYTYEGSKWHWRWNIIHDMPALIEKYGGNKNFIQELECFFDNDLYTAGNQIDLHAPYLFNQAGAPWLTQKWVRKILKEPIVQKYGTHNFFPEPIFDRVYKSTPDGYVQEMDCDYGCMAAWYNMSAMGLYQVCPGNPVYQLTAPIFRKVTINPYNKVFSIEAKNLSDTNIFIQSASFNGKPLNRSWIKHDEIVKGGELVFEMGSEPNKNWGID
ncbi:GH92 family glycosyl hydrolase [Draconibacterium aestuarii]